MQREPFLLFCYMFSPTYNLVFTLFIHKSILYQWKEVNSTGWQEVMWEGFPGFVISPLWVGTQGCGRHYGGEMGIWECLDQVLGIRGGDVVALRSSC